MTNTSTPNKKTLAQNARKTFQAMTTEEKDTFAKKNQIYFKKSEIGGVLFSLCNMHLLAQQLAPS